MPRVKPIEILRRSASAFQLVATNVLVFVVLLCGLEIAHRSYASLVNGRSFFRPDPFISPWITTDDYPPPMLGPDGRPYFRHRSVPTSIEKPPGIFRIIAVGGSTTVNHHSFEVAGIDYPTALERKLAGAEHAATIEVLNAGGNGFSTAQSLINIEFRLVEFHPDLILIMHNINDCSVNFFDGGATADYGNKYLKPYFLSPTLQGTHSLSGFLSQSRFLAWLGLPEILASKSGDLDANADHNPGIPYFKRNLNFIIEICQNHNITPVLLTQPYSMKPHRFVSQEAFLKYDEVIRLVARDQKVDLIDMFSKFGHEEAFFIDEFHYSTAGIEHFTDILSAELTPIIEEVAAPKTSHGEGSVRATESVTDHRVGATSSGR
jgi:lysophospholipase L1-like esterase